MGQPQTPVPPSLGIFRGCDFWILWNIFHQNMVVCNPAFGAFVNTGNHFEYVQSTQRYSKKAPPLLEFFAPR